MRRDPAVRSENGERGGGELQGKYRGRGQAPDSPGLGASLSHRLAQQLKKEPALTWLFS